MAGKSSSMFLAKCERLSLQCVFSRRWNLHGIIWILFLVSTSGSDSGKCCYSNASSRLEDVGTFIPNECFVVWLFSMFMEAIFFLCWKDQRNSWPLGDRKYALHLTKCFGCLSTLRCSVCIGAWRVLLFCWHRWWNVFWEFEHHSRWLGVYAYYGIPVMEVVVHDGAVGHLHVYWHSSWNPVQSTFKTSFKDFRVHQFLFVNGSYHFSNFWCYFLTV